MIITQKEEQAMSARRNITFPSYMPSWVFLKEQND